MNIYYNNKTLYVDIENNLNEDFINRMEEKIFTILDNYGINNVDIKIRQKNYDEYMFNSLINKYKKKYKGNLKIN